MEQAELEALDRAVRSLGEGRRMDRRAFTRGFALCGLMASVLLSGCESQDQRTSQLIETVSPTPAPRLRAAFSHLGLNTAWVLRGSQTAKFMGRLLQIDVVPYDGELSVDKQRRDLEEIAEQDWDFVAIHPLAVNAYLDPVRQLISRGIPVIDMDTRLADDLDGLGVVSFLEPDNVWMGEQVTTTVIEAARRAAQSDSFEIVHTQGVLTHTGAQGRAQGFRNVIERYPGVKVVDETPGEWDVGKTTRIWEDLLERHPNIRAAFFHNDEMALAALRVITKARKQKQIVVGGVDGLVDACAAVARGDMIVTVINPTGRIHSGALWIGYFLATQGERANVPKFIRIDGGIVNKDTAPGYLWL
ncbi:MAG TPA: sugar ABC transporter substrate-binding protein, partial [Roseiflexaceae bacterium]|nr:sugar ABC transporter substrate-binding protein [Roseiflexaceae bacterium]